LSDPVAIELIAAIVVVGGQIIAIWRAEVATKASQGNAIKIESVSAKTDVVVGKTDQIHDAFNSRMDAAMKTAVDLARTEAEKVAMAQVSQLEAKISSLKLAVTAAQSTSVLDATIKIIQDQNQQSINDRHELRSTQERILAKLETIAVKPADRVAEATERIANAAETKLQ
jgi:predicted acyltransferase (DUF342 family)